MVQKAERVNAPQLSARTPAARQGRPVGNVTRGTTNPNRMRRVDRWLTGPQAWRLKAANEPLVVDLGYGATPATAVELFERLAAVRPDVRVCGIEIEPERVRAALPLQRPGLTFHVGGFELPVPGRPVLVRAFNVLRQYEEQDVPGIWRLVQDRLAPNGLFIDGTCDEIGRRVAWVALDAQRPLSLSISVRFGSFGLPSEVAERLPKALIHRNVPDEPVHAFLQAMDRAWLECAPLAAFGNRQRWQGMCRALRDAGWPVQDGPARWRLGELTVGWEAVAPGHPAPGNQTPGYQGLGYQGP
ncbi:class I SAM-dependent methyltransferase [Arthrobacter sp. MAHUQ-56]